MFSIEDLIIDTSLIAFGLFFALNWRQQGTAISKFWEKQYKRFPWLESGTIQDKDLNRVVLQYSALLIGIIFVATGVCRLYKSIKEMFHVP